MKDSICTGSDSLQLQYTSLWFNTQVSAVVNKPKQEQSQSVSVTNHANLPDDKSPIYLSFRFNTSVIQNLTIIYRCLQVAIVDVIHRKGTKVKERPQSLGLSKQKSFIKTSNRRWQWPPAFRFGRSNRKTHLITSDIGPSPERLLSRNHVGLVKIHISVRNHTENSPFQQK